MSKKVKLYIWESCPFCMNAKFLLQNLNIPFDAEVIAGKPEVKQALIEKTGHRTVPYVFIGDEFIGGFNELNRIAEDGTLLEKLK